MGCSFGHGIARIAGCCNLLKLFFKSWRNGRPAKQNLFNILCPYPGEGSSIKFTHLQRYQSSKVELLLIQKRKISAGFNHKQIKISKQSTNYHQFPRDKFNGEAKVKLCLRISVGKSLWCVAHFPQQNSCSSG